MSDFDASYMSLACDIKNFGCSNRGEDVRPHYKDGTPAYTTELLHRSFTFSPDKVPVITQRKIPVKNAVRELLWIWVSQTSNLSVLHKLGCHYWDNWALPDHTIGHTYGWALQHADVTVDKQIFMSQVDYILYMIKYHPESRRILTEIWIPDELSHMSLTPCVHLTQWFVHKGKLYLNVRQRSTDFCLGLVTNVYQYYVLWKMVAQVTDYTCGEMYYDMANVHVYDRHWPTLKKQSSMKDYPSPSLWLNPDVHNFYDFTEKDIKLIDYKYGSKLKYEVAI